MHILKEVIIEMTQICNLKCIHCGSDCQPANNNKELSLEEWEKVISELHGMGVEKIVYSGGEPTLKPGFGELLLYTSKLGIKTGFISNGLVPFNESLQETLEGCELFAVGLSIDGLKNTHNCIRGSEKSWMGLMQNIAILQSQKKQICAITTLNRMNYPKLLQMAELFSLIEIDSWQLQLAMPTGRMKAQPELLLDEEEFRLICEIVSMLRQQYPDLNIQAADCFGLAPAGSIRSDEWSGCTAGICSMAIDACGNIMPCLSLQGSQSHENVREKSIAEIWTTSKGLDLNRCFEIEKVTGRCKACEYLDICRGGCNSQSLSYYGHYHSSPFCFVRSFSNSTQGESS